MSDINKAMNVQPPQVHPALKALLEYQQADEEGIMVLTSRQAIHEVADLLESAVLDARTAGREQGRRDGETIGYVRGLIAAHNAIATGFRLVEAEVKAAVMAAEVIRGAEIPEIK